MVTIRTRKLAQGKRSIYLGIYNQGYRKFEWLILYLTGNKSHDKEIMNIAKKAVTEKMLKRAQII